MIDLSSYITVSEAAQELSVHPETVRRMLRQGKLPGSKTTYDPRTGPKRPDEEGQ